MGVYVMKNLNDAELMSAREGFAENAHKQTRADLALVARNLRAEITRRVKGSPYKSGQFHNALRAIERALEHAKPFSTRGQVAA